MTAMPPLRPILNDTPATAIDVDWNFQTTEDYIATDVIKRDGSVAMEAPLNLLGPAPSLPTHAITKGYVDTQIIPIGTIWQFAGTVAPAGWAFCDFAEHSSTDPTWVPLFNVIGFTFGQNGSNFRLPDMQGRTSVGRNFAADALFGTLGQKGGSRDAVLPAHVHSMQSHYHNITDHVHGMSGHQHYTDHSHTLSGHSHDSNVRNGYEINSGNFVGSSNAVALAGASVPQNTPLTFVSRYTAITKDVTDGPQHQQTGGPSNDGTSNMSGRQYTDGPNLPNTTGMTAGAGSGGPSVGDTDSRGVAPANGNVPPYIVVNFIIRVA